MFNLSSIGKIVLFVAAELFLFTQYRSHEADIHFFIHSLVGVSAAFIIFSILILRGKKPKELLLTIFLLHQYAMFPDYLYTLGYPHEPWMNIFLGHLFFDDLPYHDWIVPIMTGIFGVIYFVVLKTHTSIRHDKADIAVH